MRGQHTGKSVLCWQKHIDIKQDTPYIGVIVDEFHQHWLLEVDGVQVRVLKGACSTKPFVARATK